MTKEKSSEYPLSGLKVLDFSRVLAGPFAGRMLCDLGADVVKVEPPDGDITRMWGAVKGGVPGYYHQQNVGKKDICIDLAAEGANALVFELVREADILIENYRPDVMARLGLGFDVLHEVNPKLIMLSISGFGHNGPESHRPAYAPIVHAETGQLARQASRGDIPYRDLPLSVADTNASLHGLVGLLAAVIQRQSTGLGQHIDIAMIDATVFTDDQIHYALEDSEHTGPLPNEVWTTGAGPVLISAELRYIWHLFNTQLGIADPASKETPLAEKIAARHAVVSDYLAELATWSEVEQKMDELNLAWGVVRDPADIRNQATVAARGAIVEVDDRAGGTRPVTQSPYRFSNARSGVRGGAPHRGEHNFEVLTGWLGKTEADVHVLRDQGVLLEDEQTLGKR
ncbi:MAG: CoA:oxalate CoA-transferase [Candidatus Azotimanducaceae bacterium]|jgi:CoA:oxalate CoA-transferase